MADINNLLGLLKLEVVQLCRLSALFYVFDVQILSIKDLFAVSTVHMCLVGVRVPSSHMIVVVGPRCEALSAVLASVGSVTRMTSNVDDEVSICLKRLSTGSHIVRSLTLLKMVWVGARELLLSLFQSEILLIFNLLTLITDIFHDIYNF